MISFFADPPGDDPMEQERILAATDVLDIALRDILREELGQTYTVSADLSQNLPQRGGGHVQVSFGASPENIEKMTARVHAGSRSGCRRKGRPRISSTAPRKPRSATTRRSSGPTTTGWAASRRSTCGSRSPAIIAKRVERINTLTPSIVQEAFKKYFPADRRTVITLVPGK